MKVLIPLPESLLLKKYLINEYYFFISITEDYFTLYFSIKRSSRKLTHFLHKRYIAVLGIFIFFVNLSTLFIVESLLLEI